MQYCTNLLPYCIVLYCTNSSRFSSVRAWFAYGTVSRMGCVCIMGLVGRDPTHSVQEFKQTIVRFAVLYLLYGSTELIVGIEIEDLDLFLFFMFVVVLASV